MTANTALTSIQSYTDLKNDPAKLKGQKKSVYDFIRTHGPVCNNSISGLSGLRLSAVCGRVNELEAAGLIRLAYIKEDPNPPHKNVKHWVINEVLDPAYKYFERQESLERRTTFKIIAVPKKIENPAQTSLWGEL